MTTSESDSRQLGLWMTSALVVGSIIGSGIFLLPVSLAPLAINATVRPSAISSRFRSGAAIGPRTRPSRSRPLRQSHGSSHNCRQRGSIYVTASVLGGCTYVALYGVGASRAAAMVTAFFVTFIVRSLAIAFGWSLPVFRQGRPA